MHNMSSNRVYVGNLSWSTSWQDLKDHMRDVGEVSYAKVLQDRDGRSKGCGIVEFATPEGASDAIAKLTDTELKGRKIFDAEEGGGAARAPPKTESSADNEGGVGGDDSATSPPVAPAAVVEGSQLFVGNLSWETGWQDLKDHFRTIGEVVRADVVVGRDGRKKGFGFVRYSNAGDAAKAIEELNGVEFMGRPLEVRLDNKA
ncbi:hypothetical protein ACHAW5_001607 [Stephanodiscus triporus]|uniref:RRM domain-containing protein n=1 Tax=Stephanodiscus triporus TaxID=2934178 RepID=A0ABD3PEF0_9STRA